MGWFVAWAIPWCPSLFIKLFLPSKRSLNSLPRDPLFCLLILLLLLLTYWLIELDLLIKNSFWFYWSFTAIAIDFLCSPKKINWSLLFVALGVVRSKVYTAPLFTLIACSLLSRRTIGVLFWYWCLKSTASVTWVIVDSILRGNGLRSVSGILGLCLFIRVACLFIAN